MTDPIRTVRVVTAGPQGVKGDPGDPGPAGPTGPQGPAGSGGGGSPLPNPFLPPYNLKGDGITYDDDALQAWTDDVSEMYLNGIQPAVLWPEMGDSRWPLPPTFLGVYKKLRPLLISRQGTYGFANQNAGMFSGQNCSVAIHACPQLSTGPRYVTSLATGPGNAWHMGVVPGGLAEQNASWINFRDLYNALAINGLSALTFECFIQLQANVVPGQDFLIASCGSLYGGLGSNLKKAFSVEFLPDFTGNAPRALLKTSTGTYFAVSSVAFTVGVTHHLAVVFNGATSTLKIFVDGVQTASVAASGTIVQEPWENVMMGHLRPIFPENGSVSYGPNAYVDGIAIFQTARYTAGFTKPTAKYVFTSGTRATTGLLVSCNFEDPQYVHVKVRHAFPDDATGLGSYIEIKNGALSLAQVGGIRIKNVRASGGGGLLTTRATPDLKAEGCVAYFSRGVGFMLQDNSYYSTFRNCTAYHNYRGCFWVHSASGILTMDDCHALSGDFPYVLAENQMDVSMSRCGVSPGQTHVAVLLKDSIGGMIANVEAMTVDDEALNTLWGYRAIILATGIARLTIRSSSLYNVTVPTSAPALFLHSEDSTHGERASIDNSVVEIVPPADAMIKFGDWASNRPVRLTGMRIPNYFGVPATLPADAAKVIEVDAAKDIEVDA